MIWWNTRRNGKSKGSGGGGGGGSGGGGGVEWGGGYRGRDQRPVGIGTLGRVP